MHKRTKISRSKSPRQANSFFQQNAESSFFSPPIQPKLNINPPHDVHEQQAEAMANKVMGLDNAAADQNYLNSAAGIQRKSEGLPAVSPAVDQSLQSSGQSLDHQTQSFMEERFGYDFSKVQIHNDPLAHQSSQEINALAYTHGHHIVFAPGQYQPNTNRGKQLLAHELTHVIQQDQASQSIVQRTVADSSRCTPTAGNRALPNPLIFLILAETMASMHISQARLALTLDLWNTTGVPSGKAFDAYKNRFGNPVAVGRKFKNRFSGTLHDTLALAQASEMRSLSARLERVENLLQRDIHYQCASTAGLARGNCFFSCRGGDVLETCSTGGNTIVVCPPFWGLNGSQQGIGIIHEGFHILFNFGDHDTAPFAQSFAQRNTEPECYASFVADVNGVTPFDPSCPPI